MGKGESKVMKSQCGRERRGETLNYWLNGVHWGFQFRDLFIYFEKQIIKLGFLKFF